MTYNDIVSIGTTGMFNLSAGLPSAGQDTLTQPMPRKRGATGPIAALRYCFGHLYSSTGYSVVIGLSAFSVLL